MRKHEWEFREYEDGNIVAVYENYGPLDLWVNRDDQCIAVHQHGMRWSLAGGGCEDIAEGMSWEDAMRRAEALAEEFIARWKVEEVS